MAERQAERELLVGEVARAGEALVMDAGGAGDVAMLQPAADVVAGVAILRLVADVVARGTAVRQVVAEPHAVAVLAAARLDPLAVDVAVSLRSVRPVAVLGEVADPARVSSSK